jgi:tetraacyldisaccharide 4'-kinase
LFPAGPMRENESRLKTVDFVVCRDGKPKENELGLEYSASGFVNLRNGNKVALDYFSGIAVHAIAGIGNPEQFFRMLDKAGAVATRHIFPDHYAYRQRDLQFGDSLPVVMTQKDAVKCRRWANDRFWYLEISADLPEALTLGIMQRLKELPHGEEPA